MTGPLRRPAAILVALSLAAGARAAEPAAPAERPLSISEQREIMVILTRAEDFAYYRKSVAELKAMLRDRPAATRFVIERGMGSSSLAAHLVSAEALARLGRQEALAAFEEHLLLDPDYGARRSVAHLHVGFGDEGIQELLHARRRRPRGHRRGHRAGRKGTGRT